MGTKTFTPQGRDLVPGCSSAWDSPVSCLWRALAISWIPTQRQSLLSITANPRPLDRSDIFFLLKLIAYLNGKISYFLKIWSHSTSITVPLLQNVCQSQIVPHCLAAVLCLFTLIPTPHSSLSPKVTKRGEFVGTRGWETCDSLLCHREPEHVL